MKNLNGAGRRLFEAVRQFTVAQRTLAIIGVAVLALGGIALGSFLARPTYSPLFTGLSTSDASGVVAQLNKDHVPYQLADGGATILVPADNVDAERLASASAGFPSSSTTGYALLDTLGVTSSEFQQNVTYKRAIEGELAKTIESIAGVASASVQLAIPQQSVFTSDTQAPTASVFVNVSESLSSDQVQAIVHLVSASYPGLTDANVSVVDQRGETLSSIGGGTSGGADQQATDYESRTRAAVQSMLDQLVGPGNSTVTVAADVSNSTGTQNSKTYTLPPGSPASSESTNQTTYGSGSGSGSGTNCGTSGVLGTDTTNSTAASCGTSTKSGTTSGSSSSSPYTQSQITKDNLVNETDTSKTITAGTLNRQTIAVAINSAAVNLPTPTIQKLVAAAAGVDPTRGDIVQVASVSFSKAAAQSAKAALAQANAASSQANTTKIITTAIWVVGGLALLVIVLLLLRKLFKRTDAPAPVDGGSFAVVPPAESGYAQPAMPTAAGHGALPMPPNPYAAMPTAVLPQPAQQFAVPVALPADASPFARLQADVDALAGADPERTADYLRALMAEGARA